MTRLQKLRKQAKAQAARAAAYRKRARRQRRNLKWRKERTAVLRGEQKHELARASVRLEVKSRRTWHRLREIATLVTKRGRRTRRKIKILEKRREDATLSTSKSVGVFDGKPVPNWMIPWLIKSRNAGWKGYVVSGVRTSQHSISLCYGICGRASCPGLCAGANSNHNADEPIEHCEGALDLTDYYNFQAIQFRIGSPLRNNLPHDRVHFSCSGH